MKSALSFLLLLLLPLVRSIDLGFIVSPLESDSPLLPSLQSRFDVRAIFDETLLLIGNQESFAKIQKLLPKAHLSSPYNPKETYVLIERPEFAFSTSKEEATWAFLTLQKIQELNLVVILSEPQRFVVGLNGMSYDGLFDHFPSETEILALPKEGIKPINRSITKELEIAKRIFVRRDDIADLVAQMSVDSMLDYDRFLTGERNDSSFNSRNSFSPEVGDAANWISSVYESHGFSTDLHYFQSNYGPNVIAVYPGSVEPNRYVVIGAHFDSRATSSSSPTQRAPGANDDGSGTAILLEISRLISKNQLKFRYSVIIGSWCGEEQGLVGSRAYAKQCRNEGVDIVAMLQGDMLAYRKPGEAAQCAFPNRYHTPELTSLLKEVVTTYVPKVQVCDTSACCSDHQGFYEQGYAATQFFERCGSIADDQYHREGDLVDRTGFDLEQWLYNGQAMFSSLLTVAELV